MAERAGWRTYLRRLPIATIAATVLAIVAAVSLAQRIPAASHRYDDPSRPITWQGFESKGPTRIGDNCWLGAHVVVTSGVTIGERCVVGANSVVTSDLEPFSLAAGSPARVISHIGAAPASE